MSADSIELFHAVSGEVAELERLLESGCDPNVVHPEHGNTPLYNACFRDRADVVRVLLASGADPNLRITYRSPVDGRVEAGIVALMLAQSAEVVTALLSGGADPNARDDAGQTALMRMVLAATPEAIELMLRAGGDPVVGSRDGHTAADIVRTRLEWLRESWDNLKQPAGEARKRKLERILTMLELAAVKHPGASQDGRAGEQ